MNLSRLTWIEALLWRWIAFTQRFASGVAFATIALAIAGATLAATTLGVDSDTTRMVSSKLEFRRAQLDYRDAFPNLENLVVLVVRGRSADEADAFVKDIVPRLRAREDAIEDVYAAAAEPFFDRNGLLFLNSAELDRVLGDLSRAAPFVRRLGPDPTLGDLLSTLADAEENSGQADIPVERLGRVYSELSRTISARLDGAPFPLSWRRMMASSDQPEALHQRIVSIQPRLDTTGLSPSRAAVRAVREEAEALNAGAERFEVEIAITGDAALRTEELQSVSRGIGLSFAASFVLVALLLSFALRSPALIGVALVSLIVSICITGGVAAIFFDALNLVSVAFTVLMVGLGVDFAIHIGLHVQEARGMGVGVRGALYRTDRDIGSALALAAVTSAIAFFAFAPTAFVGMRQLGIISGVGVAIAFAVAISLLPAAFKLFPNARARSPARGGVMGRDRFDRVRNILAIAVLTAGALSLLLMPQVRFDADPMALRDPNAPAVRSFDLLFDDPDTQPFTLSILEADADRAATLSDELAELQTVRRVVTLNSFVPKDQDEKLDAISFGLLGLSLSFGPSNADGPTLAASLDRLLIELTESNTPGAEALGAALFRLKAASSDRWAAAERDVFAFWPEQYALLQAQTQADVVTEEAIPEGLVDRFVAPDGRLRIQIDPSVDLRDPKALERFVEEVRTVDQRAAGGARSVLESGHVISEAMLQAGALAFAVVTVILFWILGDAVLVAVILFCLMLAGVLTGAAGVLLSTPFNFANVIVVPLLIGLGADSGIHLGLRARRSAAAADVYATATPRAVVYSALTTIASFGTLAFSDHRGVASMGVLLTVAIACTLVSTTIVQPWVLERLGRGQNQP